MTRSLRASLLAVLLTAPLAAAPSARAQVDPSGAAAFQATTLSLSASGEVKAAPDLATLNLGVTAQAATASQAMAQNAQAMTATLRALRAAGIPEREIQTSGLSLNPQYAYEQNQPPRLTGYEATNQVTASVRDLGRLGSVIDAAVASGANRINGVGFGLAHPQAAEDQARLEAVSALTAKAQLYARATGYAVRRLVNLSEGGGYQPESPRPMMAMTARAKNVPTVVVGGELTVRVDVTGLYELGR